MKKKTSVIVYASVFAAALAVYIVGTNISQLHTLYKCSPMDILSLLFAIPTMFFCGAGIIGALSAGFIGKNVKTACGAVFAVSAVAFLVLLIMSYNGVGGSKLLYFIENNWWLFMIPGLLFSVSISKGSEKAAS